MVNLEGIGGLLKAVAIVAGVVTLLLCGLVWLWVEVML